ncbi:hypothetical protein MSIMFI_01298 [Mycobacterium simulans]|nr:hypothetical protein MSIMFI_01298 [Mycobacterium simulans]
MTTTFAASSRHYHRKVHVFQRDPAIVSSECSVPATGVATPPKQDWPPLQLRRIVRSETLRPASLAPEQRSALFDRLHAVYSETTLGLTRDQLENVLFSADDLRLTLYYGAYGEFAGFTSIGIQCVEHEGKTVATFSPGGFLRRGYHAGVSGILFGLREALRFKLRQPHMPLGCLVRTSSPVVYRLFARTMPRVYPNRMCRTPPDVEALVRAISAGRHYTPVGESPWVVTSVAIPRDGSRMRLLDDDPDVRFFLQLNPRFTEGEALLFWVPLNAATIAGGLYRQVRLRLGR